MHCESKIPTELIEHLTCQCAGEYCIQLHDERNCRHCSTALCARINRSQVYDDTLFKVHSIIMSSQSFEQRRDKANKCQLLIVGIYSSIPGNYVIHSFNANVRILLLDYPICELVLSCAVVPCALPQMLLVLFEIRLEY